MWYVIILHTCVPKVPKKKKEEKGENLVFEWWRMRLSISDAEKNYNEILCKCERDNDR